MELGLITILLLLGIGLAVGLTAGFLGVGGGIILVPVLLDLFHIWKVPDVVFVQAAMGTSLAVSTFASGSSLMRHHKQGNVLWRLVPLLAASSFTGSWLASMVSLDVPGENLQVALAIALLLVASRMFLEKPASDRPMKSLSTTVWLLLGFGVGVFAGFTGLAGGVVLVPAMAFLTHVPTRHLAATSSGVICFAAMAGALQKLTAVPVVDPGDGFVGLVNVVAVISLAAMSIPGAQIGAMLNRRVESSTYRKIFAVLLLADAIRLILSA
ncbi:MAG: sulfite exporter TauE/SafE family protein [bacterium]